MADSPKITGQKKEEEPKAAKAGDPRVKPPAFPQVPGSTPADIAARSVSLEEWINSPEMQRLLAEEYESLQPPVPEHLRPRQRHFMDRKYTRELAEQAARNALPETKLAPRHSTELKPDESLPPEEK